MALSDNLPSRDVTLGAVRDRLPLDLGATDALAGLPTAPPNTAADRKSRQLSASLLVSPPGAWLVPSPFTTSDPRRYLSDVPTDPTGFPIDGFGSVVVALEGTYTGAQVTYEQTLDPAGIVGWFPVYGAGAQFLGLVGSNNNFSAAQQAYAFRVFGVRMRVKVLALATGVLAGRVALHTQDFTTESVSIANTNTSPVGVAVQPYPWGASPAAASSGLKANAQAIATMAAVPSKNYLTEIDISGGGATSAALLTCTIDGLVGGQRSFVIGIPAGPTTAFHHRLTFDRPLANSFVNTPIVLTVPAAGTGNTALVASISGFTQ